MIKYNYTFIYKDGRIVRKLLTPFYATTIGEKTKAIIKYGLTSKIIIPYALLKKVNK